MHKIVWYSAIIALIFSVSSCKKTEMNDIEYFMQQSANNSYSVNETHITHLPTPVQNYLKVTGVVGGYYYNNVRLKYSGFFKQKENASWSSMEAVTYITNEPLTRNWIGEINASMGKMTGLDYYYNGIGKMDIRLFPSIPFQVAEGSEINIGELLAILAEVVFNPSACLNEHIQWVQISEYAVKATIRDAGLVASGIFYFDKEFLVTRFESSERFLVSGNVKENYPWIVYVSNYKGFNGVKIPCDFRCTWQKPSNSYEYIKASVYAVEFNLNRL